MLDIISEKMKKYYQEGKKSTKKRFYLTLTKGKQMFNKKLKQEIEFLKLQIESIHTVEKSHWNYINALLDAERQNRKDLNNVIAKINQMKKTETKN